MFLLPFKEVSFKKDGRAPVLFLLFTYWKTNLVYQFGLPKIMIFVKFPNILTIIP